MWDSQEGGRTRSLPWPARLRGSVPRLQESGLPAQALQLALCPSFSLPPAAPALPPVVPFAVQVLFTSMS